MRPFEEAVLTGCNSLQDYQQAEVEAVEKFIDISKVLANSESKDQSDVINYLSGFDFRFNQISVLLVQESQVFHFLETYLTEVDSFTLF